jgi:hypothetical protein
VLNRTHRARARPLLIRQALRGSLVGVVVSRLRVAVGLLAVFVGRGGVLLGLVMLTGGMVVGRLVVMMGRGVVVGGGIIMVLGGGMLGLLGHDWLPAGVEGEAHSRY